MEIHEEIVKEVRMQDKIQVHDVWDIINERRVMLKGMSVREASEALNVSERTVFRMLEDGRLVGKRAYLPDGKYIWDIDTLSIAKVVVRKGDKVENKDEGGKK